MPAATVSKLGKGTILRYESPTPGTFIDLPNALTIGSIGAKGSFVNNTPISAPDPTFLAGDKEPEEKEFTFNDIPGDSDQEAFLAKAAAGDTWKMQVEYPSGRIADFSCVLNNWQQGEPTREGALTVVAFGQVTGGVTWSTAA